MADFDPDKYLKGESKTEFNPDAYLGEGEKKNSASQSNSDGATLNSTPEGSESETPSTQPKIKLQPTHKVETTEQLLNATRDQFLTNPAFSDENPNAEKNKKTYIDYLGSQGHDVNILKQKAQEVAESKKTLHEASAKLNANPSDFSASYDAANSLLKLGKPDDAIAMYNTTLAHLKGNEGTQGIPVQNELAKDTNYKQGKVTPASSLFGIGSALAQKGDYKSSIETYNDALKTVEQNDPTNEQLKASIRKGLAYASYKLGDKKAAKEHLEQADISQKAAQSFNAMGEQLDAEAKGDKEQQRQSDEMKSIADGMENFIKGDPKGELGSLGYLTPWGLAGHTAKDMLEGIAKGAEKVNDGIADVINGDEVGKGALKVLSGGASAAFSAIPQVALFNDAMKPINEAAQLNPDDKALQVASDVSSIPFTLYSHIAKWTGRNPETENEKNFAELMDAIIPIAGHVAGIKGVKTMDDIAKKAIEASAGKLPIEEIQKINILSDYAKNLTLEKVKTDLEKTDSPKAKEILSEIKKNEVSHEVKLKGLDELNSQLDQLELDHEDPKNKDIAPALETKINDLRKQITDTHLKAVNDHLENANDLVHISELDNQISDLESRKEGLSEAGKAEVDKLIQDKADQKKEIERKNSKLTPDELEEHEILSLAKELGNETKEGGERLKELNKKRNTFNASDVKEVPNNHKALSDEYRKKEEARIKEAEEKRKAEEFKNRSSNIPEEEKFSPEKEKFVADKIKTELIDDPEADYDKSLIKTYRKLYGDAYDKQQNAHTKENTHRLVKKYNELSFNDKKSAYGQGLFAKIKEANDSLGFSLKPRKKGNFTLLDNSGKEVKNKGIPRSSDVIQEEKRVKERQLRARTKSPDSIHEAVAQDIANGVKFDHEELKRAGKLSDADIPFGFTRKDGKGKSLEFYKNDIAERGGKSDGEYNDAQMDEISEIADIVSEYIVKGGRAKALEYLDEQQQKRENGGYTDKELSDLIESKGIEVTEEQKEEIFHEIDTLTDEEINERLKEREISERENGIGESEETNSDTLDGKIGREQKTKAEKAKELADKIRESGKYFDDKTTSAPPLLRAAWKGAHEAVALAIEGGAELADAIEKGIAHLKETEYYKKLSEKGKATLEREILNSFDKHKEDVHENVNNGNNEPPIPPIENKSEGKDDNFTKLTHEAVDEDRKKLGLDPIEKMSFDNKKDFEDASREYKQTHIELAQKLANSRTPATRKQAYVISLGIVELKGKLEMARKILAEAKESGDKDLEKESYVEMGLIENNLDIAHQALKNATSEAGRVLRLAQDAIREDMSLDSTLRTAKGYSKDGKLSEADRKMFEDICSELESAQKDLKKYEEEKSKAYAQKIIDDLAIEEKIKAGVAVEIEKINKKLSVSKRLHADKAVAALEKFQKKIRANNYSSVPIAIIDTAITTIKLALKAGIEIADAVELGIEKVKELHGKWDKEDSFRKDMLKEFKENGVKTGKAKDLVVEDGKIKNLQAKVKELVTQGLDDINDIVKEIQKEVPDMTEREIRDEISGYGKVSELSNDPVNVKLREVKRIGKLLTQKENALAGEKLLRSGLQRDTPTPKEMELQKEINDLLRENQMKLEQLPKTDDQWKTLLDKYKKRLQNQIDELQAKSDRKDFEVKKREALKLDPEALELKRKLDKIKEKRKKEIEKIRLANRGWFEKIADTAIQALRFTILTGLITPALKLGVGAGAVRSLIMNPLETLAVSAWSNIPGLRKIADQSPRYSGKATLRYNAMVKGVVKGWADVETLKDWKELAKGGKSEIDITWGKNDQQPLTLWDIWGQFHKMLKNPTRRAAFYDSMEQNLNWEGRQKNELGEYNNILDPVVQLRAASRALIDADRSIFMQDNPLSTGYKMFLKGLESKVDNGSASGDILSKLIQSDMLIVKVPTNFVGESFSYLPGGGLVKATASLIKLRGELDNLKPEQADYVGRALTKQVVGAAAFGIGYYFYKNYGGNYVQGQPNKDKPKSGEMKIGNWEVPHAMQHSVLVQTMQLGATMAWAEEYYKKDDSKNKKPEEGHKLDGYATMLTSLITQLPQVQSAKETIGALNSSTSKAMFAATLLSRLEAPAKWFAEHYDKDANGDPIKRVPQTWVDVLKMPIPGLRQQVSTAWDLIDAKRQEKTELQLLEDDYQKEVKKPNSDSKKLDSIRAKMKFIKDTNRETSLDKIVVNEKSFYELGKALGKTPHERKGLSKAQKEAIQKAIK